MAALAFLVLCCTVLAVGVYGQGNASCSGTGMDWYTSVVGETPCTTYQRLRQICNSQYQLGELTVNTPPDTCDDQIHDCCCNSVAFSLSMLCLNCQQNIGSGSGYDAGAGAYQLYLSDGGGATCSPNTNQSLTDRIQTAVCNNDIRIMDGIYTAFWSTGDWFYTYVRESLETDLSSKANQTFNKCPGQNPTSSSTVGATSTTNSGSSSSTSSSTSSPDSQQSGGTSTSSSSSLSGGAIAGIAIGAVVLIASLIGIFWLLRRRKHRRDEDMEKPNLAHEVSPFVAYGPSSSSGPSSGPMMTGFSSSRQHPTDDDMSYYPASSSGGGGGGNALAPAPVTYGDRKGDRLQLHGPQPSTSTVPLVSSPPQSSQGDTDPYSGYAGSAGARSEMGELPDRHLDAGPYVPSLERHMSGRLPPAYGEQVG